VKVSLHHLNAAGAADFTAAVGPAFEDSPWIAARTWPLRPFASVRALHDALCGTMRAASPAEQLGLIRAHPDLVGRAAREGTLTAASQREQAGAGLDSLSAAETEWFDQYNRAYHERFGFPFVICAGENKKENILKAFPVRLANERNDEIATALAEIGKIAWLRLLATIEEPPP